MRKSNPNTASTHHLKESERRRATTSTLVNDDLNEFRLR